ncbi:MAG TPA: ABC transporter permease [Tenuifilaceae bacterium]|nr:ABC transporter permease [Tenuifilaceae bacterium]HPE18074.1 ABC transporter permease [Tenuifilaceae bacterium]HPJ45444.1 ABC transporter permease [Tenuifilaceae bacterium]HPQ34061.1 ABC transporter permease [Tenuifilaceae bacterium]HRX68044.1 ABC transporter permease [Tenuifilaceae bacterium]
MILNYLKVSVRNLISQRGYSLINIFGLAVGIASALLIMLYVIDEFSYDKFHPNAKNIHRICLDAKIQDTELIGPISCVPIGPTSVNNYPDIVNFTRVFTFSGEPVVRFEDKTFVEKKVFFVDSTFFQVFDGFTLLRGDKYDVLKRPNQMVMTESTAFRYFGNDNPIGKIVKYGQDETNYEVVGVVADIPSNSHMKFDIACSFVTLPMAQSTFWIGNNNYTYLLLQDNLDPKEVDKRFVELVNTYAGPQFEQFAGFSTEEFESKGNRYSYFTQPLLGIHLKSNLAFEMEKGGNLTMVYVFMLIAIFILVIAAINFMNLSTARSAKRAKEVGVRKVVGSTRSRLIGQFLTESVTVATISLVIAVILIILAIPSFNSIAGKQLTLTSLPVAATVAIVLATILIVGFAAGSYPAFFLASFEPIKVLKGKLRTGMKNSLLRGGLVVVQFTITIGLLVSTFVVYNQISYIRNKDLGYNNKNILVINRPYAIVQEKRDAFIEELKKIPNVEAVSRSSSLPTTIIGNTVMQKQGAPSDEMNSFNFFYAHYDFDRVMGLRLVEGRYFNRDFASDSSAMIINQAAVNAFGFDGDAVGQIVMMNGTEERTVVGVVEDFHYETLHQKVSPLVIASHPVYTYIPIRIGSANRKETIQRIEAKWKEFVGDQDFDYFFLDQAVDNQYSDEKRAGILFSSFSILAIIIASLGLLGLSSYSAEQRTREIGIRKVMGANVPSVVWLLLNEINRLFLISTLVAWPIAWYLMKGWLENFTFRIKLSPTIFIAASLLAYLIAVLTVSYQAFKAARTNPSITLKYE